MSKFFVTCDFGMRIHPVTRKKDFHEGIDLRAKTGDVVRASADGEIVFGGWAGIYGNKIRIRHKGNFVTTYSHLSRFNPDFLNNKKNAAHF